MTAALLVFVLWMWSPVTTHCTEAIYIGGLHYELEGAEMWPVDAWCAGQDENGNPTTVWCGWYERTAWGATGVSAFVEQAEYEPPAPACLGCVTLTRVVAVDNDTTTRSSEPCL
jgi:hypothetical protein